MLTDRRRRHVRPHPARRQLARPRVPILVQAIRLKWEHDAAGAALPRPGLGAFWRWLAAERGERSVREREHDGQVKRP